MKKSRFTEEKIIGWGDGQRSASRPVRASGRRPPPLAKLDGLAGVTKLV